MLELKTSSITLRGTSIVQTEDGNIPVMSMTATINEAGYSSDSYTIMNQQLYDANKDTVRADKAEFITKIQEIEDAGIESVTE